MMARPIRKFVALCAALLVLLVSLPVLANQSTQGFFLGKTMMGRISVSEKNSTREYRVTNETKIISSKPYDNVSMIPKHTLIQVIHDGSTALAIIIVEVPR